ncbi:hypothetical protein ACW2Q0_27195 [Nocardia sp. R16R-3T]
MADAVAAGLLPADKSDTLAVMWWSLAHGMASLWLDGQLEKLKHPTRHHRTDAGRRHTVHLHRTGRTRRVIPGRAHPALE